MNEPMRDESLGSTAVAVIKLERDFANFVKDRERRDGEINDTLKKISDQVSALNGVYAEVRGGKKALVAVAGAIGGALAATAAWFGIKASMGP